MISRELKSQVFLTYTNLRVGLGVIALAFPLVLWFGGYASGLGTDPKGSFCEYYHTPMRNCFVGVLFAMASFLYLYKGFSWQESHALNIAGVLAVLIAIVPMDPPIDLRLMSSGSTGSGIPTAGKNLVVVADMGAGLHFRIFDRDGNAIVDREEASLTAQAGPIADFKKHLKDLWPPHTLPAAEKGRVITAVTGILGKPITRSIPAVLHNVFAVMFLLTLGYVCLFRAGDTLRLIGREAHARAYQYAYQVIGASMVLTPVAVYLLYLSRADQGTRTFFVESAAVWAFSAYWLLKTKEINDSLADEIVTLGTGEIELTPIAVLTPISPEKIVLTPISPPISPRTPRDASRPGATTKSIVLNCAKCGKRYEMPEALAGRRARCKQCGHEFRVPAPAVPHAALSRNPLD